MADTIVESTEVQVATEDGTIEACVLAFSSEPRCWISLAHSAVEDRRFEAADLFQCLMDLRDELENHGLMVCCAGARLNAWPSAMSRQMSRGYYVYLTTMGEPAGMSDIVEIFAPARPDEVATPGAQRAFHVRWFESLGKV